VNKKVIIFGVFDGLHEGHHNFIEQASKYGEEIYAIVAQDQVVERLKNKKTKHNQKQRLSFLSSHPLVNQAFLGDGEEGEYLSVKSINPNLICLGYDQKALGLDLQSKIDSGYLPLIKIVFLEAYQPNKYHSSLLN